MSQRVRLHRRQVSTRPGRCRRPRRDGDASGTPASEGLSTRSRSMRGGRPLFAGGEFESVGDADRASSPQWTCGPGSRPLGRTGHRHDRRGRSLARVAWSSAESRVRRGAETGRSRGARRRRELGHRLAALDPRRRQGDRAGSHHGRIRTSAILGRRQSHAAEPRDTRSRKRIPGAMGPTVNSGVWAIAPSGDGQTVYLGGAFTTVDGKARRRLAAPTPATARSCRGTSARVPSSARSPGAARSSGSAVSSRRSAGSSGEVSLRSRSRAPRPCWDASANGNVESCRREWGDRLRRGLVHRGRRPLAQAPRRAGSRGRRGERRDPAPDDVVQTLAVASTGASSRWGHS